MLRDDQEASGGLRFARGRAVMGIEFAVDFRLLTGTLYEFWCSGRADATERRLVLRSVARRDLEDALRMALCREGAGFLSRRTDWDMLDASELVEAVERVLELYPELAETPPARLAEHERRLRAVGA